MQINTTLDTLIEEKEAEATLAKADVYKAAAVEGELKVRKFICTTEGQQEDSQDHCDYKQYKMSANTVGSLV